VSTPPSSTITPTPGPGIRITKTADLRDRDGDRLADTGEAIIYGFTVENTGATTLEHVEVGDPRLANLNLPVTCPATTLAPGATMVCTSSPYTVTQADVDAGRVVNVATATGTTPHGIVVTSPPSRVSTPTDRSPVRAVLAYTGANSLRILAYSLLLLGAGAALLFLRRRAADPRVPTKKSK
jgi:uncharacterized repeat protein (TIGR01451 family)